MAVEMSTANNSASPETGGTGNGGAAPIERMFADVAGPDGEKSSEDKPQERRSEREPKRREKAPEADEPEHEDTEDEEDDLDDVSVDDKGEKEEGDDEENNEEDDGETEAEDDPEIDLDDKGTKAKLSELKSGYLRQADYTAKTTELSEERQVVHTYAKEMKAERDTLIEAAKKLNALALALQPTKEMWADLEKTPAEFINAQKAWKEVEDKRQEILNTARDALQSESNEALRQKSLFVQEENRKLREIMPAIFDKEKGPKIRERIFKYGERTGYTREQLEEAVDHREIMTLWKAMRYDEIKGATPNLGKPNGKSKSAPQPVQGNRAPAKAAQPARGVVRQQAERRDRLKVAQANLRKSGSVEDAAMAMTAMFG